MQLPQPERPLLIIAQSARMLAQMAVAAGYSPLVVDCYADLDTQQFALTYLKITNLSIAALKPALSQLSKSHPFTYIVYGSGFEFYPESLSYLAEHWSLLGTVPKVFQDLLNKQSFFQHLRELAIPYPPTQFTEPHDAAQWLIKPALSLGGQGIQFYPVHQQTPKATDYWQRYVPGLALSLTFLSSQKGFQIVGFNRQQSQTMGEDAFMFTGVTNLANINQQHKSQLIGYLQKLLSIYPLQGLACLDFILYEDCCYVLEINARPPASAQLYSDSVFQQHMLACNGNLPDAPLPAATPSGYQIIFSTQALIIPTAVNWPDWVQDRPTAGAIIGKGEALCSIIACENSSQKVVEQLRQRQHLIETLLFTGS
jgi:predicted ATP-grasp superfamily ATP-dependent carboligase